MRTALEDFAANLPEPIPTLRPIAEMPVRPPEGSFRQHYRIDSLGMVVPVPAFTKEVKFFLDIRLPDPVDRDRVEFEALYKEAFPAGSISREFSEGPYYSEATEYSFQGFKLARKPKA